MQILSRLCLMWACLLPVPAPAFTLSPVSQVLTPAGSGARAAYEVTNDGTEPIALEFRVAHLLKRPDGSEDLSQLEEDDFLVFPPQLVLAPGTTRTVRVRWLGDPEPERELAFRFLADQVPVDLGTAEAADDGRIHTRVRLVYHVHGTLFVRPRGTEADLVLAELERIDALEGPALRLRIENHGTRRGWIRSFRLRLVLDGQEVELDQESLPGLADLPVLAGGTRELVLPWPAALPEGEPTEATLRLGR